MAALFFIPLSRQRQRCSWQPCMIFNAISSFRQPELWHISWEVFRSDGGFTDEPAAAAGKDIAAFLLQRRRLRACKHTPRARNYAHKRLSIDLICDTMRHWPERPRTNTGPIFPKASVKALVRSPRYQIIHSCNKHIAAADVSNSRSSSLERELSVIVIHSLADTSSRATYSSGRDSTNPTMTARAVSRTGCGIGSGDGSSSLAGVSCVSG